MGSGLDNIVNTVASIMHPDTWVKVLKGALHYVIIVPFSYIRNNLWIQIVIGTILITFCVIILYLAWKNRKGYKEVYY